MVSTSDAECTRPSPAAGPDQHARHQQRRDGRDAQSLEHRRQKARGEQTHPELRHQRARARSHQHNRRVCRSGLNEGSQEVHGLGPTYHTAQAPPRLR